MPLAVLEYWAKLRKFTQTPTKKCHSLHFLELKEFKMVLNGNCGISFNILMIFNISFKDSVSDIRYIRFPLNYLIWCHGKTAVSEMWVVYFFLLSNLRLFLNVFHLGRRTFLDKNTTLPNWARFGKKFWKLCPSFFLPGNYSLKYSIHVRAGRPEIICKGNFQNCQVKCTSVQET